MDEGLSGYTKSQDDNVADELVDNVGDDNDERCLGWVVPARTMTL